MTSAVLMDLLKFECSLFLQIFMEFTETFVEVSS